MNLYDGYIEVREFEYGTAKYWYWPKTDAGLWHIRDEWAKEQSHKFVEHCRGRKVVVQAGGGLGMYPRLLSDMFDVVYTFEPNSLNFHFVALNCQKPNIIKFNAALGAEHKMISMGLEIGDSSNRNQNRGTFTVEPNTIGNIPTLRIDDLDLEACDLICLDVEGYEVEALTGAEETIKKFKPVITAEAAHFRAHVGFYIENTLGYELVDTAASDGIYVHKDFCSNK